MVTDNDSPAPTSGTLSELERAAREWVEARDMPYALVKRSELQQAAEAHANAPPSAHLHALLEAARLEERERVAELLYDWDSFFGDHHLAEGGNWACRLAHIITTNRQPPDTKYGDAKAAADDPWKGEFWQ